MFEEIKEIVRKNLPAQVSEELQNYLSEADEAFETNHNLQKEIKVLQKELSKLSKLDSQKESIKADREELKEEIAIFEKEKNKFEIEKREYKISCLNEKYADVKSLMHDVFRNQRIVYRKNEYHDQSFTDNNGMYQQNTTHTNGDSEKIEE